MVEADDAKGIDRLVDTRSCGSVRLEAVSAVITGGSENATVVRVNVGCQVVRILGCALSNRTRARPDDQLAIGELPPIARDFIDLSNRALAADEASVRIRDLLARPPDELSIAATGLEAVVDRRRGTVAVRDIATLENLRSVVDTGRALSPARARDLLARLGRLRGRLAVGGPGTAIEFVDGAGAVWLQSNLLDGGLVLYGSADPDFERAFDDQIWEILEKARQEPDTLPPGRGELHLTDNTIDWIATGRTFREAALFARLLASGNSLRSRPHVVAAETVTLTANTFAREDERPVALILANATTVTGNIGPSVNPVLVVAAGAHAAAANVRLDVRP